MFVWRLDAWWYSWSNGRASQAIVECGKATQHIKHQTHEIFAGKYDSPSHAVPCCANLSCGSRHASHGAGACASLGVRGAVLLGARGGLLDVLPSLHITK
jgi:hypothetical protein